MITIQEINKKNIWKIIKLEVEDSQKDFVATNTESILEAYITIIDNNIAMPFGIFNEHDEPIGFLMFGYGTVDEDDPELAKDNYVLWRLMIDKNHQKRGYGKEALKVALEYLRNNNKYNAKHCWVSYEPTNERARNMYLKFGFIETGEVCDGEIVAALKL